MGAACPFRLDHSPLDGHIVPIWKHMSYQPPKGIGRLLGSVIGICRHLDYLAVRHVWLLHQSLHSISNGGRWKQFDI